MTEIEIRDDVYDAIKLPDAQKERTLKEELAVSLYEQDILSFGKARSLSELSKREFHQLLGDRGIERHYTDEELDEDVRYARQ